MAQEIASGYLTLIPSLKGAAGKISAELGGIDTSAAGKHVGRGFSGGICSGLSTAKVAIGNVLANVVSAGLGGVTASIDAAVSRVDALNQFPKVMANFGYSTDDAHKAMDRLSLGIEGLPTTLDEIVSNAQMLTLTIGDLGKGTDVALALNDGMLSFGASTWGVRNAVTQLNQMITAGKYDMQSWNSINQAAPGFLDAVAVGMMGAGANAGMLRTALNEGTVSTEDFLNALVALDKEGANGIPAFSQSVLNATGGIATSFRNVKTAIVKNLANIINTINGDEGLIVGFFNNCKDSVNIAGGAISNAVINLKQTFIALKEGTTSVSEVLDNFFTSIKEKGAAAFDSLSTAVSGKLEPVFARLPQPIQQAMTAIGNAVTNIASYFNGLQIPLAAFAVLLLGMVPQLGLFGGALLGVGSKIGLLSGLLVGIPGKLGAMRGAVLQSGGVLAALSSVFVKVSSKIHAIGVAIVFAGGGLRGVLNVVGAALASILNPVALVSAAIVALGVAFAYLMTTNEGFRATVMSLAASIGQSLMPILVIVGTALQNLATTLLPAITNMMTMIMPILGQIIIIIMQIAAAIAPLVTMLVSVVVPILTQIVQVITLFVTQIVSMVLPVVAEILAVIQTVMPTIQAIFTTVMGVILGIIMQAWPTIQAVITTVMNVITAVIQTCWPLIQSIIDSCMKIIQQVIAVISAAISGDWGAFWNACKGIASTVWEAIKNVVSTAIGIVKSILSSAMSGIKSLWNSAWSAVKSYVSEAWEGIKSSVSDSISNVVSYVSELPGRILSALGDLGSLLWNAGSQIVSGLYQGIKDTIGNVYNFVSGIGSKIASLKGPKEYDLKLLIPNGKWIMDSLNTGIVKGSTKVFKTIKGLTSDIADTDFQPTTVSYRGPARSSNRGSNETVINNYHSIGDVRIDASSLKDFATIEDFFNYIAMVKDVT